MAFRRMEPLAHTLAGACLAESGLKRLTPLASSTLIIAANLPDVDGACYLHSADVAFALRRGWTHGILAIALLPLALTAVMIVVDRVMARRHPERPRAKPLALLGLAALGVLSHPFLDWLNNYGVRLLMPFSERWFYGDTLFIVDPWLWLILGGAAMLAWTTHTRGRVTAAALGAGTTALMLLAPVVPEWARAAWMTGLAVWALARARVSEPGRPGVAMGALASLDSTSPRCTPDRGSPSGRCANWPSRADGPPSRSPRCPCRPNRSADRSSSSRRTATTSCPSPGPSARRPESRRPSSPEARTTPLSTRRSSAPFVQGVRRWLRFPSYEVLPLPNGGRRVIIRDARFAIGNRPGFGVVAIVDLDAALTPRPGPDLTN